MAAQRDLPDPIRQKWADVLGAVYQRLEMIADDVDKQDWSSVCESAAILFRSAGTILASATASRPPPPRSTCQRGWWRRSQRSSGC